MLAIDGFVSSHTTEFAGRWYRHAGARERAIRDELGMTSTRFAQLLNRPLDDPVAAVEFPSTTARLRRQRDRRLAQKRGDRVT